METGALGRAKVVVGTRSAIFAPLDHLGLIILDEEQEASYKSESTPRYHARDVAKYRIAHARGLLVLGSATPAVESMFHAKAGITICFLCASAIIRGRCPKLSSLI